MKAFLRSKLIVLILAFLPLIPLWYFEYPPFQDYPNHLARVQIIRAYEGSDFYRENVSLEYFAGVLPKPYLALDIFAGKVVPFLDANDAVKIFLSVYFFLYVLALYLLCRQLMLDFGILSLYSLPLIYSFYFYMGFLNFVFSIPLALFAIWAMERFGDQGEKKYLFLAGFFSLATYFAHIFAFFALTIFLVGYFLRKGLARKQVMILIAFILPAAVLTIVFRERLFSGYHLIHLSKFNLSYIYMYFHHLPVVLRVVSGIFFTSAIYLMLKGSTFRKKEYLITSVLLVIFYLFLPKVGYLFVRALLFALVLFPLSLNMREGKGSDILRYLLVIVFFINFSIMIRAYSDFNGNFSVKCSDAIAEKSLVFPIDVTDPKTSTVSGKHPNPYEHAWGYLLKDKEFLTPFLFQDVLTPMRFRDRKIASFWIRTPSGRDMTAGFLNDEIRTNFDYILLTGRDARVESLLNAFSDKVCEDSLVSLYEVRKKV